MPELHALPVRVRLQEDESGLGFLMRTAHANGMTLTQLMSLAGVRTPVWPTPMDVRRLAFAASTSATDLAARIRSRSSADGRREFGFVGHRWMSVSALRVKALQVCPRCLREAEYCRLSWELAGYCVCPRHGCCLTGCCSFCGLPITWSRPAVAVCRCGRYLSAGPSGEGGSGACWQASRWLASCIFAPDATSEAPLWPAWITGAGPDAFFQLAMALGRSQAGACAGMPACRRDPSPNDIAALITTAHARSAEISPDSTPLSQQLVDQIDAPLIERLEKHGATATGRSLAAQLLLRMRRQTPLDLLRRPWRTSPPRRGQLELFGNG